MSTNDVIQGIYIAYYGRFADAGGLAYWSARLDAEGGNLDNVINYFGNSPEAETLFGSMTNTAKINYIYNTLFGRDGDADGVEFYTDMLTAGTASAADIAKRIADGAQGTDATAIDNKVAAANSLTASVSASEYSGDAAAAAGRALIAQVTDTVTAPTSTWAQALATGGQTEGSTFTLTTSSTRDTVSGSAANDTIDGTVLDSVESDTIIDGSSTDTDTMNLVVSGSINPTQAIGIENVNVTAKYGSATVTGANYIGTELVTVDSLITSGTATVSGLGSSSIAAVKAGTNIATLNVASATSTGTGTGVAVDAGSATSIGLTGADGVTDNFTFTLNGGSKTITIASDLFDDAADQINLVGATATNTVTFGAAHDVKKIVASGSQDMTIKGADTVFTANTVTNSLDAGKALTVTVTGTAGTADLSKVSASSIVLQGTGGSGVYTFADAANVKLDTDQALSVKAGTGATVLNLDVAKADTGTITNAATVFTTINVAANTVDVTDLDLLAGSTATVNLSGTKNVTTTTTTAKAIDASALTGVLTATVTGANETISGGTGNDVITTADFVLTVSTGAGDDTVKLAGTPTAHKLVLDGGAGNDTLKVTSATDLSGATNNTSVITGFEYVDVNALALTLTQKQLFTNGAFTLKDTSTGATTGSLTIKDDGDSSDLYDLSGISFSGAKTVGVTVSNLGAASTVVGSSGADNITGSTAADTISGGAGSDTISGGGGSDTLAGGSGGDSITGGTGTDSIDGGDGADTILGAAGNDTMIGGVGGDTFVLDLAAATGTDSIYLGASSGTLTDDAGDIVKFSGADFTSMGSATGVEHVYGFEAGTGSDVIQFTAGLLSPVTLASTAVTEISATVVAEVTSLANETAFTGLTSTVFVEIGNDITAANATDAGSVWAVIVNGASTATYADNIISSQKIIIAVDDGTDSYLWMFNSGTATIASSADIKLVGVVHGVTDFSNGDLAVV